MSHSLLINRPVANYLEAVITAGQTLTAAVAKKLEIDTPIFNDCFTEASDVFTCTKAGVYVIHATFYKNNTATQVVGLTLGVTHYVWAHARADFANVATWVAELAIGDTLEFQGFNTSGGTGGWLGKFLAVKLQ